METSSKFFQLHCKLNFFVDYHDIPISFSKHVPLQESYLLEKSMLLPDEALLLSLPHCSNQRLVKRNLDKNNFCRIFSRAFTLCQKTGRIFFYCSLAKKQTWGLPIPVILIWSMLWTFFFNLDPRLGPRHQSWRLGAYWGEAEHHGGLPGKGLH